MYCVECGAENPDLGRYCFKCGRPLFQSEQDPKTQNQAAGANTKDIHNQRQSTDLDNELEGAQYAKSDLSAKAPEGQAPLPSPRSEVSRDYQNSGPRTCPKCRVTNPPEASVCDCGYNFDTKTIKMSALNLSRIQVRPWVRYWARIFDIFFFSIFGGSAIGILFPAFYKSLSDAASEQMISLLMIFIWVFVEAWLLSKYETTPGKWLFRINIKLASGDTISYSKAFGRSLKVWWRGLGIGFPIASLATLITSYQHLTRDMVTTWDQDEGFVITHETIGVPRVILATALFMAVFIFLIISQMPK